GPLGQLGECRLHTLEPLALGQLGRSRARHDNDVAAVAKPGCQRPEGLAYEALDVVSRYRPADPARDRQPETRTVGGGVLEHVQHEVAVGARAPVTVDALELGAARQAPPVG